jgi:hypothetical protein
MSSPSREILTAIVSLDPDLAAVLGAFGIAAVLSLGGVWRRRREVARSCAECGRRIVAGVKSCDCGF